MGVSAPCGVRRSPREGRRLECSGFGSDRAGRVERTVGRRRNGRGAEGLRVGWTRLEAVGGGLGGLGGPWPRPSSRREEGPDKQAGRVPDMLPPPATLSSRDTADLRSPGTQPGQAGSGVPAWSKAFGVVLTPGRSGDVGPTPPATPCWRPFQNHPAISDSEGEEPNTGRLETPGTQVCLSHGCACWGHWWPLSGEGGGQGAGAMHRVSHSAAEKAGP